MTIAVAEQYYPARGETGVVGRFDYAETPDIPASHAAGEIILKKIPVLVAKAAGSSDYTPQKLPTDPIARKAMTDRFPEAWLAFQGIMVPVPGTQLEERLYDLPMITRSELARWHMNSITTWEQIADLSDAGCDHVGFGTRKRREEVMIAMGRTPPGKPPNIQLSPHMTAEQAILSLPDGAALVAAHKRAIADLTGEPLHEEIPLGLPSVPGSGMVDLGAPEVQAAIAAAVQLAMQAALAAKPKRESKPRSHKAKPKAEAPVDE